ncbi:exodeoxyribonuclease VII large subunit [Cerasicoccus fimbriatus]|uniref:exodeoxyribonuclease VII large subunit n=1 Tax=Cerasicoccus fimbriatus TaxID=3014554 RepID=UPI0022B38ED5|nr:exodeoxyribonuclease VII large subunit [Cerasicoccus sp. TK19100]
MALSPKQQAEDSISVGEFTRRVRALLTKNIPPCWVQGEVSNLRRQASGHVYFTLKDDASQLPCVLFRMDAMRQTIDLRDGLAVQVHGGIDVYEPRGAYQLICRTVMEVGQGRLQERFEQLKKKLAAEGLFDAERKRTIPAWPKAVAVVTSPTGAAIQDFCRVLERRDWRGRVVIAGAKVQGEGAVGDITEALRKIHAWGQADLIVVMRGGGSLEDLWCFNEEAVARAVAASPTPIISAVGHEIDFTLSDFAADKRAETPTAAAELISSQFIELRDRVRELGRDFNYGIDEVLKTQRHELELLQRRLQLHHPKAQVRQSQLRLDELHARFEALVKAQLAEGGSDLRLLRQRFAGSSPEKRVRYLGEQLVALQRRFDRASREELRRQRKQLEVMRARLEGVSLQQTLKRGYAIARDQQGRVVTRKEGLAKGDLLGLDFADGEVRTRVEEL